MHPLIQQTYSAISEELRGLDIAATQARPGGDGASWSIHEVLEHLLATYTICTASLESRLAKGRPLESSLNLKARFWRWLIIEVGYFPPGRKSPEAVRPGVVSLTPQDGDALDESVRTALGDLDRALDRVHTVYPTQPVVTHMILEPLTVRQWRMFHRVHARHHAKQIARVKAAIGFA